MRVLLPFGYAVNAQNALSHQRATIRLYAETQMMPQRWIDTKECYINW